jgi:phosphatidylglycerophosphate synthase
MLANLLKHSFTPIMSRFFWVSGFAIYCIFNHYYLAGFSSLKSGIDASDGELARIKNTVYRQIS